MDNVIENELARTIARAFALRDAVALILAYQAKQSNDANRHFQKIADALQARLDELPDGMGDLKERVRVEQDWLVGAAQAFLRLGQP